MKQNNITKKHISIAKRILACVMAGCMAFGYCGNLKLPAVYATTAKTPDTNIREQFIDISPATPKNGTATSAFYTDAQGINYFLYSNQTCKVLGYESNIGNNLVIPDKITVNGTTYSVTSIKEKAFYSCDSLTSVTIGKNITTIGKYAFAYCYNLKTVTASEGLTTIEEYAFYGSNHLTTITLPSTVTSMLNSAFLNCPSLKAINVNSNNQTYLSVDGVLYTKAGDTLLLCPNGKESVKIPSGVTTIGELAFYYCKSLSSITIPSGVTTIGKYAFKDCITLTHVTISNSVTQISNYAFDSCSSLTNITIPSSVIHIGDYAFSNCINLTTVENHAKISYLSPYTFQNCRSLTKVTIPETATKIKEGAFENCISLKSITLPSNMDAIYDGAFKCCTHLTSINIPVGLTFIGDHAFFGCFQLKSLIIPSRTCGIGTEAFLHCKNLTIYGEPGSEAETYAKNNGISFHTAYRIIYHLNEGSNNGKNPDMYTTKTDVTLASPTRAGYTFKGWYTTENFKSNSKVTKVSKNSNGTVTLYAKWAEVKKPAKAALKTVKSKKSGTLTITAKKVKSVAGYEYAVATDKKFTKNVKTVTSKKLTTTVKGLKKKKTYYVKVRAYKLDSANGKIYGDYSKVKKVKIKK